MKIINTIAALTCVGYALHYTDVLPASQYEVYVSRAASTLRGMVDNAIRSTAPAVVEAAKPCPPTECKREVVRTVGEAPLPQAVVVTVPAQPTYAPTPVVAQPTWPSLTLFQSTPAISAPASAGPAPVTQAAPQPAPQPVAQATSQPAADAPAVFSATAPAISTISIPRPAVSQDTTTIRTEPAVAKPATKPAGSEGTEAPAKPRKAATAPARVKTSAKRPSTQDGARPQSDWVSSAMSRG